MLICVKSPRSCVSQAEPLEVGRTRFEMCWSIEYLRALAFVMCGSALSFKRMRQKFWAWFMEMALHMIEWADMAWRCIYIKERKKYEIFSLYPAIFLLFYLCFNQAIPTWWCPPNSHSAKQRIKALWGCRQRNTTAAREYTPFMPE